MSRNQPPRTPVHFPRMKVRGARNRAKSAARHEQRTMLRVRLERAPRGSAPGMFTTELVVDPNGTHVLATRTVTDGWGRRVK